LLTSNHDEIGAATIGEEQKLVGAEKSVPLSAMEGSHYYIDFENLEVY
jgi:hypothetical protein